jgi:hypothetical protein
MRYRRDCLDRVSSRFATPHISFYRNSARRVGSGSRSIQADSLASSWNSLPSLCARNTQSAWQGSRLLPLVHHGTLPSGAKHECDPFAMWNLSRNGRVNQDCVWTTPRYQDGRIQLHGRASVLETPRSTNGPHRHRTGHLCCWGRFRGNKPNLTFCCRSQERKALSLVQLSAVTSELYIF